jgi:hypothetical protein
VQLGYAHEVFFVLDATEYERASKAAENALYSDDSVAPTRFLKTLPSLRSALLTLKPLKYESTDEGKSVSWMQFTVTVIAPSIFQTGTGHKGRCLPQKHRHLSLKSRAVGLSRTGKRHRGSGRPLSPATPPYMRVRVRRFSGLRNTVEQARETKRPLLTSAARSE